jgi:hypothetical protein
MFDVPVEIPVTTPLPTETAEPTVATDASLLVHVPPAVASVSVVTTGIHTEAVPLITAGIALVVNEAITLQLVPKP